MTKRKHADCAAVFAGNEHNEDEFNCLVRSVQHQRHTRNIRLIVMLTMVFSLINFGALLEDGHSYGGNKTFEMSRKRVDFDSHIASAYTDHNFRRVYRMGKDTFQNLHHLLLPKLMEIFFPKQGGKRNPATNKYLIGTKIRLSIALRFFAGADPLDLFGWHGVSLISVFVSIWGVINAVNGTDALKFAFPDMAEQVEIARRFKGKSGAGFANVLGLGLMVC